MTEIRGFCRHKQQEADILGYGVPARAIFFDSRGAETLDHCLASFRGRPGTLVIAHDLRLLGGTKRQVADIMATLEKSGIKVIDLSHPEDTTVAQQIQTANVAISGSRFQGDRKRAKQQGREGGRGKGKSAWNKRDDIAPKWLVDRITDHRGVPWAVKLELLAPHFSEATLRRRYGINAEKRA
jgi:hypothetical protein